MQCGQYSQGSSAINLRIVFFLLDSFYYKNSSFFSVADRFNS